ncbi:very short patch repair endonuclease [Azospirillum sp. A26]|uniref:very short patch repair endonuclease n=1 Tax=Azospirillum sp. A26 TaxID=3160607 RepID=UPI00366F2433
MADVLSPAERGKLMSRIRGADTKPEIAVRRLLHGMGYRFRLHVRTLPGTPDLVFPGRRKVIMVHGCFWHRHEGCRRASRPKSRAEYWEPKLEGNVRRDREAVAALEAGGWEVAVVWECEVRDSKALAARLSDFLGKPGGKITSKSPAPTG